MIDLLVMFAIIGFGLLLLAVAPPISPVAGLLFIIYLQMKDNEVKK